MLKLLVWQPCSEKHCSRWWQSCNMKAGYQSTLGGGQSSPVNQVHLPANIQWTRNKLFWVFEGLQTLVSAYCMYIVYCSRLIYSWKHHSHSHRTEAQTHCLAAVCLSLQSKPSFGISHTLPSTNILCFSKVCFTPLHFYERPTLVPVFTNGKQSEEYFCFPQPPPLKGEKWKQSSHLFCRSILYSEQQEWPCQAPSPGTTPRISASSHHSSELCLRASVLYLDLFYASLSDMCLKVTVSFLYDISAYKTFHRKSLVWGSGENLYFHWSQLYHHSEAQSPSSASPPAPCCLMNGQSLHPAEG